MNRPNFFEEATLRLPWLLSLGLAVQLTLLCCANPCAAQDFNDPVGISAGNGTALFPATALNYADDLYVVFREAGELVLTAGPNFSGDTLTLTSNGLDHSDPSIHISPGLTVTVAYEEEDPSDGAQGNEIKFVTYGIFTGLSEPTNLSKSLLLDRSPRLASSESSERSLFWVREDELGVARIYFSGDFDEGSEVAEGDSPSSVVDTDETVHVVYVRDGNLYYDWNDGDGFYGEAELTIGGEDSEPDVQLDANGNLHIVFERLGDVHYVTSDGLGGFTEPFPLTSSSASSSQARLVVAGDEMVVVYEEGQDLWIVEILDGEKASEPENVTNSVAAEHDACLEIDSVGYRHLVYSANDEIYYTNTAPPPENIAEASVTYGEAPLEVAFSHMGAGDIRSQFWEFGDGGYSAEAAPVHVYENAGVYDVRLTVYGPGGEISKIYKDFIEVIPTQSTMRIPFIRVFKGEANVVIPVLGTHILPAQGFQVAARYDADVLTVEEITTNATEVAGLEPEFEALNLVSDAGANSYFTLGVIIDLIDPFDGRALEVGTDQRLCNIKVDVTFGASTPEQTFIDLRNDLGNPILENIFTVDDDGFARSVSPALSDGEISIEDLGFPPPRVFLRGDADSSGALGLADAIFALKNLFQNGNDPTCLDATDVDDSGAVSLADPLRLLSFLFSSGKSPPYPYPGYGLDPTNDDALGDCK